MPETARETLGTRQIEKPRCNDACDRGKLLQASGLRNKAQRFQQVDRVVRAIMKEAKENRTLSGNC